MYSTGDVKIEYCRGSKMSICQACLSTNRTLSSPGEYVQVYQNICLNSYPVKSDLFFCWECIAVMRKIKAFRERVWAAQKILSHPYSDHQNDLPKCLSKLETTKIIPDKVFVFEEQKRSINERENVKHNIEIKQEMEFDIENESYNYEPLTEDVKVENEKPVNTYQTFKHGCKKKRTKKYRMILNGNGGRALQKIKIGILDVASWLERERTSNYYSNLVNKCDKCVLKLRRKEKLEEHNRTHHDESIGGYACDICRTHFATKSSMTSHVASHFYIHHCNVCGFEAYSSGHISDHMRGHKKTVQCLDCLACYDNVRHFFTHYKAMHCVYMCDHCDKKCKTKRSLEKHMRRHLTHECKQCGVTFKSYFTLRNHTELKHVTKRTEEAFCVQCDTQFRNPLLYRRHLATSTAHRHERSAARIKKEKVPCPECENVYSRRSYMMNHYRHVHRNESKYYCLDCDKYFLNRTRYVDHRRYNHEGFVKEKDKLCNICGRGFAANRTLTNHMRTHSGERPYVCTYCDSKFTQKQAMLSHVKFIHLKDRRKPGFV